MGNRQNITLYFNWDKIGIKKIVCIWVMIHGIITIVLFLSTLFQKEQRSTLYLMEERVVDNSPSMKLIALGIVIVSVFIMVIVLFLYIVISHQE